MATFYVSKAPCSSLTTPGEIVNLNVGGKRFSTSRQTLSWIPDSFFSSMLSGRILSQTDETGAIFIDRDPNLFTLILNYLRTKEIDLSNVNINSLRHEAEYFGITPLVRRLSLLEDIDQCSCGDILFHGALPAPVPPMPNLEAVEMRTLGSATGSPRRPVSSQSQEIRGHTRHFSTQSESPKLGHHRSMSVDARVTLQEAPLRPSQATPFEDPLRITILKGHHNWIAVAYPHFVCIYRMKDSTGWNLVWTSEYIDELVDRVALNSKVIYPSAENPSRMIAAAHGHQIHLWSLLSDGGSREIGAFNLNVPADALFFIGSQLVALSHTGRIGVWHAMTQNWQIQDVQPITSHDTAGSFLLLGCDNGSVYYVDMQKFPLRMKDNDLLVTELYKDPSGDKVTALSVYLTSKTSLHGNWIEIAYGTSSGTVRVIVQHPETVGQGPQLFQTFTVHRSTVTKVMLSEKHLVSVCSEYNHVRTWNVTRFRGMISTQPGSMPLASFKVVAIENLDPQISYVAGNDFGPFGEQDDQQVFVQKVVPDTDQLFVRRSSTGKRVCVIKSVDGSTISAFCVHECEGSSRMGSRPRRYIFTGHTNGSIQMWDLSTAIELADKSADKSANEAELGGPTARELVRLLDTCDLSNSRCTTPSISPSPSLRGVGAITPQQRRKWEAEPSPPRMAGPVAGPSTQAQGAAGSASVAGAVSKSPSRDVHRLTRL